MERISVQLEVPGPVAQRHHCVECLHQDVRHHLLSAQAGFRNPPGRDNQGVPVRPPAHLSQSPLRRCLRQSRAETKINRERCRPRLSGLVLNLIS